MSVLKVKDKNGKIVDIPAIKGASAYEIAVKNGFKGTEEEWLESLKGGGGSTAVNPKIIAAQTVVTLLEGSATAQGGTITVSMESVSVANSPDSYFQLMIEALIVAPDFGGNVLVYTPPEAGTITFIDPNDGNEISVDVIAGIIYIFYAFFDDEYNTTIKYKPQYGTGIRELLLNGVNL